MFCQRLIEILKSEPAYWVAQNSVGAVLPLLFGLVQSLRFPLACIAIVFYGITSQTLSSDTTIGGRIIAGTLFMGATLSGGLIGFTVVSLSWLSRGSNVRSLLEVAHDLDLPSFREYFQGNGDFYDAINLIYKDIQLIRQADSTAVSTIYWVLLLVLFAVMSLPWAWMRSTTSTSLVIGISMMGFSLTCVIAIFGLLMPITGQYAFWTLAYGGFLKASCIAMLGTIVGALVIYVKSAHDEFRKVFARVLKDSGRTISHVSSCMQESMLAAANTGMDLTNVPSKSVSHVQNYDEVLRKTSVKSYLVLLQDLQEANRLLSSSKAEPPIPGFASQWGSNVALYTNVCESIENVISQIGCVEMIYVSVRNGMGNTSRDAEDNGEQSTSWVTSQDVPTGLKLVGKVSSICASISSVLQSSSDALSRMPLGQPCSGNHISWRPKPKVFWLDLYHQLFLVFDDVDMLAYLEKSAISGIREILNNVGMKSMPFRLGGSSLVLFTAVESLIDYMVQLDQRIATALDVTDREYFDAAEIHAILRRRVMGQNDENIDQKTCWKKDEKSRLVAIKTSPVFKAFMLDILLGTGGMGIFIYLMGCLDLLKKVKRFMYNPTAQHEPKQSQPTFQQIVFFVKYWSGILLLMTTVILIGWLAVGDSESNLYNQEQIAKYLIKWMPFNAPIAVAICLNTTIDSSIIKIFLRSTMIAFGGALGYVSMLNGRLAQNPYYIFWITMLVNAFFSMFSSAGYYARYSLFLVVYTYFSVVVCQYLGICCIAGDVWEFSGRTISTIAGATFALVFNWLVMPVYTSQVIFKEEDTLLGENVNTIEDSLRQGPDILSQKNPESDISQMKHGNVGPFKEEDALLGLYHDISEKAVRSFKSRLSLCSKILEEKRVNSLDDWRFFVFDITLIPLPLACKLTFIKVARMGLYINVCMHALKTSIYPYCEGKLSEQLLSTMLEDSVDLLNATQKLYALIGENLNEKSQDENSKTEIKIVSLLDLIVDIRSGLSKQFESSIHKSWEGTINISDLKCLVFFQYFFASLDEVYHLGFELCKNENMKIRDSYWSFIIAMNRKQENFSFGS